ncbi:MAG: 2-C-methyl-D-erythritol 4-phosphate cytidylyltransferase [Chloroflexi bacterium]|nr:2-C-methyl-D-erythritol 4-phosphate cytidylyltransferase [Chloroflexota bacterium]
MTTMDVIVVAAGRSTRMQGIDKVFVPVSGRPLLGYCLHVFERSPVVGRIALVVSESNLAEARRFVAERLYEKVRAIVAGGARRQDSVRKGLEALPGGEWVAVHDGARPFIDEDMLERGLAAVQTAGAAIAAIPVKDTIKSVGQDRVIKGTPPRESLWAAQTPQIFNRALLARAHREVLKDVTDDAAMVEDLGQKVTVFEGSPLNIKVTAPEDLLIAEAIAASLPATPHPSQFPVGGRSEGHVVISRPGPGIGGAELRATGVGFRAPGVGISIPSPQRGEGGRSPGEGALRRYGTGFDGHKLAEGGPLRLGGMDVPFALHLEGHSDGDVLLHAIASAILGAAGLGDLGRHFPSTDPALKSIDSREILRRTRRLAAAAGWMTEFVDATIIAQRPKLSPYLEQMGRTIAETLGLEPGAVNLKATTTDHVGAIGQGEGIAAQAIATVRPV